ncbi:phytanoyl-CoA dioxygenase family protein [Sphingomonas arantia]|uniref:Phytanoyl-CoA dioxygenase family protein n=1 Tax=Sphingomonas arantia TaxID=1460676 RepID=A0ABW4TX85_9SPHN
MTELSDLTLKRDGASLHSGAVADVVPNLLAELSWLPTGRAGVRLTGHTALATMLMPSGRIGRLAARALDAACLPVRAILFDKSAATNWALGWHQDRTIVVKERHDMPGFGPWTIKQGLQHVAPPFAYLSAMVTLRVHLDDVSPDNAPLRIAAGTHRLGLLPEPVIPGVVARHPLHDCTAKAGDVWIYATPILHASDRAKSVTRRRVLQVDYSAKALPSPLEWRGID